MNTNTRKWIIDISISLLLSFIILGGLYIYYNYTALMNAEDDFYEPIELQGKGNTMGNNESDDISLTVHKPEDNKSFNFMLIGNDSRRGEFSRSDTLLVGSYNADKNKVLLFSIPRDTYVNIPGHGYDKINHAYAFGGAALSAATIEKNFDFPIQRYASINFNGFIELVDLVGGVPMYVEKDFIYENAKYGEFPINVKQGQQILNGRDALGYARFRHDAEGDFGRIRRQQQLIEKVFNKLNSPKTIMRLPEMIQILGNNLKTNFKVEEMKDYLILLSKKGNLSFEFDTLSGKGGVASNGVYYFHVSEEEIQRFKTKMNNFNNNISNDKQLESK